MFLDPVPRLRAPRPERSDAGGAAPAPSRTTTLVVEAPERPTETPPAPVDPVALFDGAAVDAALAGLRTVDLPERERAAHAERLAAVVRAGGPALVDECVRRMLTGEREKAQLLLAVAPHLPDSAFLPLRHAPDPLIGAYADLRAGRLRGITDVHEPALVATDIGDDVLESVADDIRDRLLDGAEPDPARTKAEYVEEWRRAIRGRVADWTAQVPAGDRWRVGDRVHVIARDIARTSWTNDFRFVATLDPAGGWHVAEFLRFDEDEKYLEAATTDLDGDATPELLVEGRWDPFARWHVVPGGAATPWARAVGVIEWSDRRLVVHGRDFEGPRIRAWTLREYADGRFDALGVVWTPVP